MTSIVIVNFRNPPLLKLCLKSIIDVLSPDFQREIIVIDISSTVETRNIVSEFAGVKLFSFKDNIGYTRGVNEGIKNSTGAQVLILNPDIIPLKNSIEMMADYLVKDNQIGMIGPELLNFDGSHQASYFRFPSPMTLFYRRTFFGKFGLGKKNLEYFIMNDKKSSDINEADWLMGSAIMINKKAIDKVGLMDEEMFLYMSDIDWPKRFWENGYKVIYFSKSRMYHYHKRDSKGRFGALDIFFKKQSRWHLIDAIKYFRKNGISAKSFTS